MVIMALFPIGRAATLFRGFYPLDPPLRKRLVFSFLGNVADNQFSTVLHRIAD
jgi:hypothetical protein